MTQNLFDDKIGAIESSTKAENGNDKMQNKLRFFMLSVDMHISWKFMFLLGNWVVEYQLF